MNFGTTICDYVEEVVKPTTPTRAVADWLTTAYWLFAGATGEEILRRRDVWLRSSSAKLVSIALEMDEFGLARTREDEFAILNEIRVRHPQLADICAERERRHGT